MTGVPFRPFVQPEVKDVTDKLAEVLGRYIPEGYGFALLIFEMNVPEGFMNYISNCDREDMVAALHELLANLEGRGHEPAKELQ